MGSEAAREHDRLAMVTHAPPVRVALVGLERMLGEILEDAVLSGEGMALVEADAPAPRS